MLQFNFLLKGPILLKPILVLCLVLMGNQVLSQSFLELDTLKAPEIMSNLYSKKIADDSLQTSYVIWIKKTVLEHYHEAHTENIYVLEGKAEMMINGVKQKVKKGDYLNIPKGTRHAVTRVISRKPLKVISIQSPQFDGTDRILVPYPHCDF
jgi:quercetin dioxygenase-like cupin family protein